MVRRSSAVEQLTVNQLVVGSIPTAGAIKPRKIKELPKTPSRVMVYFWPWGNVWGNN